METMKSSNPLKHRPAGQFEQTRFEKLHNVIFDNSKEGSRQVALEIASLIRERAAKGKRCVLGLATGSSPIGVYGELVRMHREAGLSVGNVARFHLDEYPPTHRSNIQPHHYFTHQTLCQRVDI